MMVLNREGLEYSWTCLDIVNCDFSFLRSCGKSRLQKSKTQPLGKNPKLYRIWIPIHIQHIQHLSCAQKRGSADFRFGLKCHEVKFGI